MWSSSIAKAARAAQPFWAVVEGPARIGDAQVGRGEWKASQ
ncbi:hypothetical protein [Paraburkholderia sp. BL6665CI2N2]|nr:hypothetical protein [Paraburkholderia sp. BL6665CI2N2]